MSRLFPVLAIAACVATPPTWQGDVAAWAYDEPLPDLPLVDQAGRSFTLGRYRDGWLLVGFVFTRCADGRACPMTMSRLVATDRAYAAADARDAPRLSVLALTLDPDHDTPERLAAWGATWGVDPARFTLATGARDLLAETLPSMFSILALPDADQRLVHTVKITLVRPGLVIDESWSDDAYDPDAVVRRILSETPAR